LHIDSQATDFAAAVHDHSGDDITSGAVAEIHIDPTIARDSEINWGNLSDIPTEFYDGVDNDSGWDIMAVSAGSGLSGGGLSGRIALAVAYGGTGSAATVAHSYHNHTIEPTCNENDNYDFDVDGRDLGTLIINFDPDRLTGLAARFGQFCPQNVINLMGLTHERFFYY